MPKGIMKVLDAKNVILHLFILEEKIKNFFVENVGVYRILR